MKYFARDHNPADRSKWFYKHMPCSVIAVGVDDTNSVCELKIVIMGKECEPISVPWKNGEFADVTYVIPD